MVHLKYKSAWFGYLSYPLTHGVRRRRHIYFHEEQFCFNHMTNNVAPDDKIVCNVKQFVMCSTGKLLLIYICNKELLVVASHKELQYMPFCCDLRYFDAKSI